jgi:hypothetical protein
MRTGRLYDVSNVEAFRVTGNVRMACVYRARRGETSGPVTRWAARSWYQIAAALDKL